MDKYLVEILKAFNTIIIPGLGALNLTNPETGECLFMPYLKYDDGKLSQYISETEGMSDNDAKNLIAKYVREIEAKLNIGESYDMYQFGSFVKNSSGDIEFNAWKKETIEENPISEEKGEMEVLPEEAIITDETVMTEFVREEEKNEEIIQEKNNPIGELEEDINILTSKIGEIPVDLPVIAEEPLIFETVSVTEYTPESEDIEKNYSEADQWADDLDVLPLNAKIERPKKPIIEKIKKDKKQRKPLLFVLIIVGIFLIGGVLTFDTLFNNIEKAAPIIAKETPVKKSENRLLKKPFIKKTIKKEERKKVTIITTEKSSVPIKETQADITNSYHIIGGAFIDKSNADRYQNRLVSEGNQSAIIGQFDNLYIVSIASFSSIEAANNALTGARSISSKAWVFKWP
jgi:hypothetical protein